MERCRERIPSCRWISRSEPIDLELVEGGEKTAPSLQVYPETSHMEVKRVLEAGYGTGMKGVADPTENEQAVRYSSFGRASAQDEYAFSHVSQSRPNS